MRAAEREPPRRPLPGGNVLLVAQFTWREAVGRRLVWAIALLTVVFLALYFAGVNLMLDSFQRRAEQLGSGLSPERLLVPNAVLVLMGMYIVNFLGGLMAVFTTVATVSGEVDSGTIQSLLPKPIRRWEFIVGKWLGHVSLVLPFVVLLGLGMVYGSSLLTGYLPPNPPAAVALMSLGALFLLTLALLGSSIFSTMTNGVVLFMAYGLGWAGGVLSSVGSLTNSPRLERLGDYTSLVVPSDQLWRGASVYLQPEIILRSQEVTGGNPFVGSELLPAAYLVWVGLYVVGLLLAAVWVFNRRDF